MTGASPISLQRQRTLMLQRRTFLFARRILEACPRRFANEPSRVIWRQLVRAAPSASGNLEEADEASSRRDFIFRMRLVLREVKESRRWLKFIAECRLQNHEQLVGAEEEARQLAAIFATIVRNASRRTQL